MSKLWMLRVVSMTLVLILLQTFKCQKLAAVLMDALIWLMCSVRLGILTA